ncbi:hypothetical protein ACSBR1_004140 [Camellia fascicularis]
MDLMGFNSHIFAKICRNSKWFRPRHHPRDQVFLLRRFPAQQGSNILEFNGHRGHKSRILGSMSSVSQNLIESGYGFNELCFNFPQNLQQKTQNQCFDNNGFLWKNSNHQSMAFSQSITVQIKKQKQEIDRVISLQSESEALTYELASKTN